MSLELYKRIRQRREQLELSQEELAQKWDTNLGLP